MAKAYVIRAGQVWSSHEADLPVGTPAVKKTECNIIEVLTNMDGKLPMFVIKVGDEPPKVADLGQLVTTFKAPESAYE